VAVELTRSLVRSALRALDAATTDVAEAVSSAKAYANDALRLVTSEALQLHGGLGMTDEADHRTVSSNERGLRLSLLGDSAFHRNVVAAANGL